MYCDNFRIIRNKTEDYENRLKGVDKSETSLNEFCSFLTEVSLKLMGNTITYTDTAVNKMIELHSSILKLGFFHSEKGSNFSQMIDFTLQDFLVKLSSLIGISKGVYEITPEIVELAFMDLYEFFNMQLDFVKDKVRGSLDYGEGWCGAMDSDQGCLEWLYNKTLDGKEILLNDFKKEIVNIKSCGLDMAQKHYQRFEKNKWILISHEFQKYYVSLTFTPQYIGSKINLHVGKAGNVGKEYSNIISRLKDINGVLPALPTLPTYKPVEL